MAPPSGRYKQDFNDFLHSEGVIKSYCSERNVHGVTKLGYYVEVDDPSITPIVFKPKGVINFTPGGAAKRSIQAHFY